MWAVAGNVNAALTVAMQRQITIPGTTRTHPIRKHVRQAAAREQKLRDDSDIKLFALSFTAFFVCFYSFIL